MPPDIKFISLNFSTFCSWPPVTMAMASYLWLVPAAPSLLGCFNCWSLIFLTQVGVQEKEGSTTLTVGVFFPSCHQSILWQIFDFPSASGCAGPQGSHVPCAVVSAQNLHLTSRCGGSITSLSSLFQGLTTLSAKNLFLISNYSSSHAPKNANNGVDLSLSALFSPIVSWG